MEKISPALYHHQCSTKTVFTRNLRDGKVITTSKCFDLTNITEGSTHHNSFVSKLLVIIVDFCHTFHSRIFFWLKSLLIGIFDIPIIDTTNKRRDEVNIGFSTRNSLYIERKNKIKKLSTVVPLIRSTNS